MGKEEIARYKPFFPFPQCFEKLSVSDALNEYLWSKGLGAPPPKKKKKKKLLFLHVYSTSLLKTLLEKENLLLLSNYSFSHNVFNPFREVYAIVITLKLMFANSFSLEESKICHLGNGYYTDQMTQIFQKVLLA